MKIDKAQLKEMVRKVVRKKLLEMELAEREETHVNDGRLNQDDVSKHLKQEKEKTLRLRSQRQRQDMKNTSRGLELECDQGGSEHSHEKDGDFLSKLENLLFQSESKARR